MRKTPDELQRTIRAERTAVLVVNTHARHGQRLFRRACSELARRGIRLLASYAVRTPARLPQVMREAVHQGSHLVVVGGGDGTISSVVDEVAYRDIALGILPLGTGNSFARTLGIPYALRHAVNVIIEGDIAVTDLGKVNDDYFANAVDIGISSDTARILTRKIKRYVGRLAYVIDGARVMWSHRPFTCHFHTETQEFTMRAHQVVIANGRFYGDTPVTPDASPHDGKLVVMLMDGESRWELARIMVAFENQRHLELPQVRYFTATDIVLDTDPPQNIDVDGELTSVTPAHFTVARDALRVLVPRALE